jgi:5'(3')-deoxyribonucleotidase
MQPLCDLDGVLANFTDGANVVHGRPGYEVVQWDWYKEWDMTAAEFWAPIKAAGDYFYTRYVEPYWWLDKVLDMLREHGPLVIATASPSHPGLMASKVEWINHYIGKCEVITIKNKERLASDATVLIDDSDENIGAFSAAGGAVITFPQPWNIMSRFVPNHVEYLEDNLSLLGGV